jgi:hypothetical protein
VDAALTGRPGDLVDEHRQRRRLILSIDLL